MDIPLLAIYSDSYARLQELTNIIDSHGYTINKMTKLGVVVVKNPNVDTLKLLQKTVLDYAVRLGLKYLFSPFLTSIFILQFIFYFIYKASIHMFYIKIIINIFLFVYSLYGICN